ncbi:MAG TPA: alpha/beta hydrolase-fold protein [Planctomycetota bacterium]
MLATYSRELAGGARLSLFPIESEALRDNALGDPSARANPLLVPAGGGGGLPLVAILVGFTGSGHRVLNVALWSENLPERLARGMAEGRIPQAVFVWPACETRLGGSQFLDSPAVGRYETFVRDELVPAVEAAHSCGGAGRRVLAGKSSGGFGALTLAMRNPGFAAAVGCHAGDMGFEYGYMRDFPEALNVWRRHGGPAAFLAALPGLKIGTPEIHAVSTLAMAACYSPDPAEPLGFALPVDPATGALHEAVWRRWLAHDPLRMIADADHAAALRELRGLYLDAGERDEFALQWGLRRFVRALDAADVRHRAEFFDGGHFDMDVRYETSLPFLLGAL